MQNLLNAAPLLMVTPRSSFPFLFISCCPPWWRLLWGTCLLCRNASDGGRNRLISTGNENSVRKDMGRAWATSPSSGRRCRYRVERLARIPRQITLVDHKGFSY